MKSEYKDILIIYEIQLQLYMTYRNTIIYERNVRF